MPTRSSFFVRLASSRLRPGAKPPCGAISWMGWRWNLQHDVTSTAGRSPLPIAMINRNGSLLHWSASAVPILG